MTDECIRRFVSSGCVDFIRQCAVPIAQGQAGRAVLVGTGALLDVGGNCCLLTARHVLREFESQGGLAQMIVPLPRQAVKLGPSSGVELDGGQMEHWPNSGPGTFRKVEALVGPEQDPFDLGALMVVDENLACQLRSNYHSLGPELFLSSDDDVESYRLAGYPVGARLDVQGKTAWQFFWYPTSRLQKPPTGIDWERPLSPDVDLLLGPPKGTFDQRGQPVSKPDLRGMSGSIVWAVTRCTAPDKLWSPERILRIAGVQKTSVPGRCVRATRVVALPQLLRAIEQAC